MKEAREVILSPVVSEKSYTSIDRGVYTFIVHPDAAKPEIRDAIEKIFDVKVAQVNTLWRKGKRKRTRYTWGRRVSEKRAVVTLVAGQSIEIFNPK